MGNPPSCFYFIDYFLKKNFLNIDTKFFPSDFRPKFFYTHLYKLNLFLNILEYI